MKRKRSTWHQASLELAKLAELVEVLLLPEVLEVFEVLWLSLVPRLLLSSQNQVFKTSQDQSLNSCF